MRAKDFIPASKPRNPVVRQQQTSGAGAHKDKKRAEKQGDVKHKKQAVPMEAFSQAAADKNKLKYQKSGRVGHGLDWKDYGDNYKTLVNDIVDKFDNITRIVQYADAPEPTKYKIVERFFKKYGYPFELFNDVITAIEKRASGETHRFRKEDVAEAQLDEIDRRGFLKGMSGAALAAAGVGGAQASTNPTSDKIVVTLVMGDKVKKLDLTPKNFKDVKEAGKWLENFLDDRGINNWNAKIERGEQGSKNYQRMTIQDTKAEDYKKQGVAEVSKDTLDRYVAKASDAHGHADFAARMSKDDPTLRSYHKDQKKTAEKRRQGISRALDRMSREESIEEYGDTAKGQKMLTKVQKRAVDRMIKADDKRDANAAKKNQQTANRAWDRMTGVDESWGQRRFEVDGYIYMTDIDEEEDNRKIFHMIKTPDGKTIDVDFTPYAYMTKADVELYIKLDMPKRQGVGPLDSERLQKMAQIKGVAMLDPKMARAGMSRNG